MIWRRAPGISMNEALRLLAAASLALFMCAPLAITAQSHCARGIRQQRVRVHGHSLNAQIEVTNIVRLSIGSDFGSIHPFARLFLERFGFDRLNHYGPVQLLEPPASLWRDERPKAGRSPPLHS